MSQEKKDARSFLSFYAGEAQVPFFVMLGLFVLTNMLTIVNFTPGVAAVVERARLMINTVLLWLCPMVFAFYLILWKMTPWTVLVGIGAIVAVFALWNGIGGYNELYCTVVAVFLALFAYKRNYRTVLLIFFAAHLTTIMVGLVGLKLGYATPRFKLDSTDFGVSWGLIYPNHLGRMVYMVLTLAWYLWGQKYRLLTTLIFWAAAAIMWFYVKCKTIALFFIAFPVCWWLITLGQSMHLGHRTPKFLRGMLRWLITLFPFLMLGVTYVVGRQKIALDRMFLGTGFYSLVMRFISAGILFQVYGFPLLGRDILNLSAPMEFMNGHLYVSDIVDNAYIYYLIALGGIALIACLVWLALANWKMLKRHDYALLLLSIFMLGYGLIEIATFQFEHNFIWFYPLAACEASMIVRKQSGAVCA